MKNSNITKPFIESGTLNIPLEHATLLLSQTISIEGQELAVVNKTFLFDVLLPAFDKLPEQDMRSAVMEAGKRIRRKGYDSKSLNLDQALDIILGEAAVMECMKEATRLLQENSPVSEYDRGGNEDASDLC